MKLIALLLLAMQMAGCSWIFGDSFRDRSEDYLQAKQMPVMKLPETAQAVAFEDQLVIPEIGDKSVPEDFEVPKPPKVLTGKQDQRVTHYSELSKPKYTAQLLEPEESLPSIHIAAPIEVSWSLVKGALEKASYKVLDLDRSGGIFYLDVRGEVTPEEDCLIFGWFCSEEELPESVQLLVVSAADGAFVKVAEDELAPELIQSQILNKVFQLLPL